MPGTGWKDKLVMGVLNPRELDGAEREWRE